MTRFCTSPALDDHNNHNDHCSVSSELIKKQQTHQLQNNINSMQLINVADMSVQQSSGAHQHTLLSATAMYPQQQPQQQQRQQQTQLLEVSSNQLQQQQSGTGNELIGYYFGSISRDTAEWILKTHGNQMDGAYLLRSSGPNDDFVLSLMVIVAYNNNNAPTNANAIAATATNSTTNSIEVLHYKIVETEDSFVALHGQVGDEKFATIDELIDKAQGVATKPRWPIHRQSLESQILPPTYWGLTVDQVRLAILIKAKQWGFPLLSSLFQTPQQQQQDQTSSGQLTNFISQQQLQQITTVAPNNNNCLEAGVNSTGGGSIANVTTLNNETIRTLIYKSLHEFQPWFHGSISREEAERRIEEGSLRDGRFLVRERDNYSYAMCISHKKTTKHYRIDVLPTGELAIQDGRKFTSLMALVSHYTIMSDGLWCALTEACTRPIQAATNSGRGLASSGQQHRISAATMSQVRAFNQQYNSVMNQQTTNLYCVPPVNNVGLRNNANGMILPPVGKLSIENKSSDPQLMLHQNQSQQSTTALSSSSDAGKGLSCVSHQVGGAIKAPIREWLQNINHKWSQLINSKSQHHQSLNSFLFGNQNPLNNHCRHNHRTQQHHHNHHMNNHQHQQRRKCKNGHTSCGCIQQQMMMNANLRAAPVMMATATPHDSGQHLAQLRDGDFYATSKIHNNSSCCATTLCCPAPVVANIKDMGTGGGFVPATTAAVANNNNNLARLQSNSAFNNSDHSLTATNSLLTHLPQNSGFSLNSQSFIGSPLFAVKPLTASQLDKRDRLNSNHRDGGTSSNSGSGNSGGENGGVEEEKLISPAQSVSANLNINNPYNLSADIYGSQTSTVLVNNDHHLPTSSSSSSGTNINNFLPRALNSSQRLQYNSASIGKATKNTDDHQVFAATAAPAVATTQPSTAGAIHAGPILCGQHAGPAYRYTNCSDENSFKPCFHRPIAPYRAADDSQLVTSATQLAGPAAMAKFVQFQDGQCWRTYRDTRSIQMAYLSSRQQQASPNQQQAHTANHHHQLSTQKNQVPITRELSGCGGAQQQATTNSQQQQFYLTKNNTAFINNPPPSQQVKGGRNLACQLSNRSIVPKNINHNDNQLLLSKQQQVAKSSCKDIDLMDCGENDMIFDFEYDPKLIKSSSIETLCGIGSGGGDNDEEDEETPIDYNKSNTELMMSLQSCWLAANHSQQQQQQQHNSILSPIPSTQYLYNSSLREDNPTMSQNNNSCNANELFGQQTPSTDNNILSSLIIDNGQNNEQFDHMKKKHDLDELTTALLAELTASLKAQVDLKNKRAGFCLHNSEKSPSDHHQTQHSSNNGQDRQTSERVETNPLELVNEFDTLIPNNNR